MKRVLGLFLAVYLGFCLVGCGSLEVSLGAFSEAGLCFYLPENAEPVADSSFDILYRTDGVCFAAAKDEFQNYSDRQEAAAALTEEQYAELVRLQSGIASSFERDKNGTLTVPYTEGGFFHYAAVIKGGDGFWVLTFSCSEEQAEERMPDFELWAAAARAD